MKKMYTLCYFMKGFDKMLTKNFYSWEYMVEFIESNYETIITIQYSTSDGYVSSENYHE